MNTDTKDDWRPKLNPDLVMRILDGQAVLLDKANERVHQLNEVATVILQLCDGARSEVEIVVSIVDQYDVSKDKAAADARELINNMKTLSIIV